MGDRLKAPAVGGPGRYRITGWDGEHGIGFSVWHLTGPETNVVDRDTGFVVLAGSVCLETAGAELRVERRSLFDERPSTLLVPAGAEVRIRPEGPAELAVVEARASGLAAAQAISASRVRVEQRGRGVLHDAAHREVRTVVDDASGPAGAPWVIGEVVTLPGRWSSYPPHHHPQPEIYHYRFSRSGGYGHAELADQVLKVRHGETLVIDPGQTHAQCAAPGYGMWYLWVIRHLAKSRYARPEFEESHRWTLDPRAEYWWPRDE